MGRSLRARRWGAAPWLPMRSPNTICPRARAMRCLPRASAMRSRSRTSSMLLAGIFAIGQKPSGTRDPFGLRRAAIGIVRIVLEHRVELDLIALLDQAVRAAAAGRHRSARRGHRQRDLRLHPRAAARAVPRACRAERHQHRALRCRAGDAAAARCSTSTRACARWSISWRAPKARASRRPTSASRTSCENPTRAQVQRRSSIRMLLRLSRLSARSARRCRRCSAAVVTAYRGARLRPAHWIGWPRCDRRSIASSIEVLVNDPDEALRRNRTALLVAAARTVRRHRRAVVSSGLSTASSPSSAPMSPVGLRQLIGSLVFTGLLPAVDLLLRHLLLLRLPVPALPATLRCSRASGGG